MYSFIWKNKDSYLDFGIVIKERPPVVRAERNVLEIEIPGRDGDLTVDDGTYKAITFPFVCTLLDTTNQDEVILWLDGFSDLILSWQSDRSYRAKLINRIDITQSLSILGDFPLIFKGQPHPSMIENPVITLTAPGSLYNGGTYKSKPVIKVYGTGTIDLSVNGNVIHLTNVVGYVTIDSDLMDCFKDTALQNNQMNGEFPELKVGENTISWTGTVTSVLITPNWRYL